MYGRSEIDLKFPTPIPVNITYQTAFVDDAGKLQIRKDVYGRDATMLSLLEERPRQGPGERGRAFAAELRAPGRRNLPAGVSFASDSSSSGPSFFERLFGGGQRTPPAPVGRKPQQQPGYHPLIRCPGRRPEITQQIKGLAPRAGPFTLTIIHLDFGTGHFFATLDGLG